MAGGVLIAAVLLSFVLSLATWRSPALWPLQILAGAILIAVGYWLIGDGIGVIAIAAAIVPFWRAFGLYRRRRLAGATA